TLALAARTGQDEGMTNKKQKLSELSVPARIGIVVGGTLQVTFAFLAFWDLGHRTAAEIRGPRLAWVPAILVNWIGPAAYFLFARKR
ncbi:MAG: hypothetical protein KDH99_13100, partial [Alcanivoracaceae bacterium]|nr:hypothetical protein [Alcanivoracaceae bacterium]